MKNEFLWNTIKFNNYILASNQNSLDYLPGTNQLEESVLVKKTVGILMGNNIQNYK